MKTYVILHILMVCSTLTAASRALYIAPRSDGLPGTGTMSDPFNAATAEKLWQAWQKTAFRSDGVSDQAIIFLPGAYQCTNELRLPASAGNVILSGYGACITYTDATLEGQRTILCTEWAGNDGITIEGFTLDCGSQVAYRANGKVGGVFSRGRNNIVRDVTVRNLSVYNKQPFTAAHESFGIVLHADGGIASGNAIVGTSGGEAQVLTGIAVSGTDSLVNGNVVDFRDSDPSNKLTSFGYSLYGSRLLLSGNVARGVDAAVSMDIAGAGEANTWRDNVIVGNQFSGNEMVVRIENNVQSYENWLWVGNNFYSKGKRWLSMWTNGDKWAANKINAHHFVGNVFSGATLPSNIALLNFQEPHSFIGNSFNTMPNIHFGTNANTLYGADNVVRGEENNRAFGGR